MRRWLFGGVMLLGLAGFAGCSTLGYYLQAFNGQMELTRKARPIPQVLDDEHTPAELKVRLEHVQEIRTFASHDLALPDNGSYRRYADLQRPYVVWNVFATEGVLRRSAAVVLPDRRLRGLPRLLRPGRQPTRSRRNSARRVWTSTWAACRPIRRWAGWTTRC